MDDEDDEDRGEALIKQRQIERRKERRAKDKERERRLGYSDEATPDTSAPPTGQPDDVFIAQQMRGSIGRSVSRARTPSANRRQPSDSYFYQYARSETGSEAPRDAGLGFSPRDELRPSSIYSSTADEDQEGPQDHGSILQDVVAEVVDQQTVAGSNGSEDEEAEESGEGDEAVTLKDRQDVSATFMSELMSGNQYRTSLRFANLETSTVPQIPISHPKRRVRTPFHPLRCSRKTPSTR